MYNIANMLPHAGIMLLVDEIINVNEIEISTKSIIKDNIFCEDKKFMSFKLIEIMAQSLGLYKSFNDKKNKNDVAFLIGCRKFQIFKPFLEVGNEIQTYAKLSIQDENGFGVYDCECFFDKNLVAKASLSVFNPSKEKLEEIKNA